MRLFPTTPPFVCRCCFWSWPIFIFLHFFLSPPLPTHSFSVPSLHSTSSLTSTPTTVSIPPVPSNTANPPTAAPPPFKTHTQSQFDHKIIFALSASALSVLLLLALIMGCLVKFIRIRFGRRPRSDRALVAAAADDDFEEEKKEDCVRKYNWDELEKMSLNFSRVIGSGGFSTVFLGDLRGSGLRAIKIQVGSDYLNRVFHQELEILLNLRHQNIVKLLGYCDEQEKSALVFEYVPNGNLHERLHSRGGGEEQKQRKQSNSSHKPSKSSVLSWRNRMGIAFQLAQALEYLHEKCPLQIVHGDIKSANILLDQNQNCKLCDFGSAKMGFSSAIMPSNGKKKVMMGSPGYTDPQYLRTGIASKKNDVYSYGVIILELVTGMEAFCEEKGQLLTAIVGPTLRGFGGGGGGATEVAGLVDPRLGADFDAKEVSAIMSLAALCLGQTPALRPSATQILHAFHDQIPSICFLSSSQEKTLPCP